MNTTNGSFLAISADIVNADDLLLLGIDKIDCDKLFADNFRNLLYSRRFGWRLTIIQSDRHMFVGGDTTLLLLTPAELRKPHYHLFHLSARKLYKLLKRVAPSLNCS